MLLVALAICALGILQIYSATHGTPWMKQALWLGGGLFLMWLLARMDYHTLLSQVPVFYGILLALLVLTLAAGSYTGGSRRWIVLPLGFRFQAAEIGKVVIVLLVARYVSELRSDRLEWGDLVRIGLLVGVPAGLVLAEPDLGTTLTYVSILAMGIFFGGVQWRHLLVIVLITLVLLPCGWYLAKDYQKARVLTFLDPMRDPMRSGYQVIQSKIAVGAGGIWGKGVARGSQTQLRFLPVAYTDFVISAFAEEHGFVGILVLFGLYFLLLMQIVQNAQRAPDRAGMLICMGVATLLLFHLLVNAGMAVGRMPTTGIPLPLMSYGGSSMMSVFAMLGLVNNVRLRRFGT